MNLPGERTDGPSSQTPAAAQDSLTDTGKPSNQDIQPTLLQPIRYSHQPYIACSRASECHLPTLASPTSRLPSNSAANLRLSLFLDHPAHLLTRCFPRSSVPLRRALTSSLILPELLQGCGARAHHQLQLVRQLLLQQHRQILRLQRPARCLLLHRQFR